MASSFLRGSEHYVWCTTSVLGKGATGSVFQGVDKKTGESVAVKTFNAHSHMRPAAVQMREFEALKKVNHENIVKLLAIEEDQEGRGKVIVMELCTGGSLFNILDDPENSYGLPQNEFLLVFGHLAAGIKHLRDNKLVHRDLKPGNIMKFISDDGQTIYKLTDFGAARELEDNQPFASLYGTEEYLHPHLYEKAVLRKPSNRSFTANVDLWSIGVTIYHVITGNLPFRAYGGRKNRETLHYITTKKASGVISGTQSCEEGEIQWSTTLPAHCHLSEGLKTLVTPLLAGLLEQDRQKSWSFDKYFKEVTDILSKRVIHVFYANRISSVEVFVEPHAQIEHFRDHIHMQTKVPPQDQILLLNNEHFERKVKPDTHASAFTVTSSEQPIFLYNSDDNNVQMPTQLELPKFPVFPTNIHVENDASLAKAACSVGYECRRRVDTFTITDVLIKTGVDLFIIVLSTTINLLFNKIRHLDDQMRIICDFAYVVEEVLMKTAKTHRTEINVEKLKSLINELSSLKERFDGTANNVTQMHSRYCSQDTLNDEWSMSMSGKRTPSTTRASPKAKHLVNSLRESWQHLMRDRATRNLTYNDEQFHALEKIKLDSNGERIKSLLNDVEPAIKQMADCLSDWYKFAQTIYRKAEILEKDVREMERKLNGMQNEIKQFYNGAKSVPVGKLNKVNERTLIQFMQKYQTGILLKENAQLVDKLHDLLTSSICTKSCEAESEKENLCDK